MITATEVCADNRLRNIIGVAVDRSVTDVFQDAWTQATTGSCAPIYRIVEQAAVKAI